MNKTYWGTWVIGVIMVAHAHASGGPEVLAIPCLMGFPELVKQHQDVLDETVAKHINQSPKSQKECLQKSLIPYQKICHDFLSGLLLSNNFDDGLSGAGAVIEKHEKALPDFYRAIGKCLPH